MGLEEEFGLFKRTNGNGRLFRNGTGVGIVSGRPKRKLRRIVTRPAGFLLKPIAREAKRRAGKRAKRIAKGLFESPRKPISVREALLAERKQILKGKTGKERKETIRELMGG